MKMDRRQFIGTAGIGAAAACAGAIGIASGLRGRAYFTQDRALPGSIVTLKMDIDDASHTHVLFVARTAEGDKTLSSVRGAEKIEAEVPFVKTSADAYMLLAVVTDDVGRMLESSPVEVLAEPFCFGM